MSDLSSEERKRLRNAERDLRREMREQERLREKAIDGLKDLINEALDAGQEPAASVKKHAKANKLNYDEIYQEVLEERKTAKEKTVLREKEDELRPIIMQYVLEKTKLSRAEMRAEILINYSVSMATYVKVESQILNETYSLWIANLVHSPLNTDRECLENLARLLGKNIDNDVKDFIREEERKEHEASERVRMIQKGDRIKKILWGVTAGLIVLQIVFLGWWTILTGLITLAIAGYIHLDYFS